MNDLIPFYVDVSNAMLPILLKYTHMHICIFYGSVNLTILCGINYEVQNVLMSTI